MPTSRLLEDGRTRELVRDRGLPLAALTSDQHTRSTLVEMLLDPDDEHGAGYYQGVSDTCGHMLTALRAGGETNHHRTSVLIVIFGLLQCMADAGVQLCLTGEPKG